MKLFNKNNTGTDEIRKLASFTASLKFDHVEESLALALDWLGQTIGGPLVTQLDEFYRLDTPTELQAEATLLAQRCTINKAFGLATAKGQIHFDNSGVHVKWSDDYRPANEQLPAFLKALQTDALSFLDQLLRLVRANTTIFTAWQPDAEIYNRLLIRSPHQLLQLVEVPSPTAFYYTTAAHQLRAQALLAQPAAGEFWADILWTATQTATRQTVATVAHLPTEGNTATIYLVADLREWYQYSDANAWTKVAREVDDLLHHALLLVAHQALILQTETQLAQVRDLMKTSSGKNHLSEFTSFLAQERTYVQATTEALRALREQRIALATPPEPSKIPEDTSDYFFTSNTFII